MNRTKLIILGVLAVMAGALLYVAYRRWGFWTPVGILGTVMTGAGVITGMTKINNDPGRAARPDMGARGTVKVKTKDAEGKTVVVEKRTRPRRPGSGRF